MIRRPSAKFCCECGTSLQNVEIDDDFGLPCPNTTKCKHVTYENPKPVGAVILPYKSGVLTVRRGIHPCKGELCLPCGYISTGETWQQGAAREVWEEINVIIPEDVIAQMHSYATMSSSNTDSVVVFAIVDTFEIKPFVINREATERTVLTSWRRGKSLLFLSSRSTCSLLEVNTITKY